MEHTRNYLVHYFLCGVIGFLVALLLMTADLTRLGGQLGSGSTILTLTGSTQLTSTGSTQYFGIYTQTTEDDLVIIGNDDLTNVDLSDLDAIDGIMFVDDINQDGEVSDADLAILGQQVDAMADISESSSSSDEGGNNDSCEGSGMELCRCYCRVDVPVCEGGDRSYASMPLCREEWDGNDCDRIGYYHTQLDAAACGALDGTSCSGFVRNANGNPEEIAGTEVQGTYIGCGMQTL